MADLKLTDKFNVELTVKEMTILAAALHLLVLKRPDVIDITDEIAQKFANALGLDLDEI